MFTVPLNQSRLIFIPPQDGIIERPRVGQVWLKTAKPDASPAEKDAYTRAESSIMKAIETVVVGHLRDPLPKRLVIESENFTLTATRLSWDYGKTLDFSWGGQRVETMPDKWWFLLETDA